MTTRKSIKSDTTLDIPAIPEVEIPDLEADDLKEKVALIAANLAESINLDKELKPGWFPNEKEVMKNAFIEYWALGPNRNVRMLQRKWKARADAGIDVYTTRYATIHKWYESFKWDIRCENLDARIRGETVQLMISSTMDTLTTGFAQITARVDVLKQLAALLWEDLQDEDKRWFSDPKQVGRNNVVDIRRFNSPLVDTFRRTLADIADEMGHRNKQDPLETLNVDRVDQKPIEEIRDDRWKSVASVLAEVLHVDLEVIDAKFTSDELPTDDEE